MLFWGTNVCLYTAFSQGCRLLGLVEDFLSNQLPSRIISYRQIVVLCTRIWPPNQRHCKVNFATCIWFEELTQVFVQILWVFWQRHRYSDSQNWPRSLLVSYHPVLSYHLTPQHHCQHITNMVSNINKHLIYRAIHICFWHNSSSKSKTLVGFLSIEKCVLVKQY